MKVAIVHDYLNQMGGAEKVLEVLCELFPEAPVYTLLADKSKISETLRNVDIRESFISRLPFVKKHYKKYLALFPIAIEQFDFSEYDLVLSSSSAFAKGIITKPGTKHICYCYTPMRYSWDLYHRYLKEDGPGGLYAKVLPFLLHYIRMWDKVSVDRVDDYIAISKNVQRRIEKYYRRESVVIYPHVNLGNFFINPQGPDDYFLVVSRLLPYKRVDIVIEAFNELKLPLVVIGDGYDRKRLEKMAGSTIQFLGYQSDEIIANYYSKCEAFLFAGEEDFGITPVEAQASGRPVIAYGAGGALETVIDGQTGLFFKDQTKEAIIDSINRFNSMHFDAESIRNQALKFDREVLKKNLLTYINEQMNNFNK